MTDTVQIITPYAQLDGSTIFRWKPGDREEQHEPDCGCYLCVVGRGGDPWTQPDDLTPARVRAR